MIPLYFLEKYYSQFKIVRIALSAYSLKDHYLFGKCIARAIGSKRVAVIGSGDLSHKLVDTGPYGYVPEGPELDKKITECFASGNLQKLLEIDPELAEKGAECGLPAFAMMAGTLDGLSVKSELLSYEGPFGVGYAVATFELPELFASQDDASVNYEKHEEDAWVNLARKTIESYVGEGCRSDIPSDLPAELMDKKAGVFVTLHKDGELRGCIGTIMPTTQSVANEIQQNAVSAAVEDPRFYPVTKDELPLLEIHVDVLGDAEEIDSIAKLDIKRYGVIVTNGTRRGLLLPDLDGIDSVEQQVDIAKRKAGVLPDEPVKLERFEVIRHE